MTTYTLHQGNNADTLKNYPDDHFDSIVTDPPYGIEFLGKDWDSNTGAIETWEQCFRVLKPGGHLLAFSAARTYHHLATNIEAVGFEIRDQLMWIYGSGFPKAQDVGKNIDKRNGKKSKSNEYRGPDTQTVESAGANSVQRCVVCRSSTGPIHKKCSRDDCPMPWIKPSIDNEWAGWKTALKPAHEPIVMARKPMKGSTVDNVLEHGVGALNIDATRIPSEERKVLAPKSGTYQCVENSHSDTIATADNMEYRSYGDRYPSNVMGEIPDYQKYFYCPKVSRSERHIGFEDPGPRHPGADGGGYQVHDVNHRDITLADRGIKGDFFSNNIADYGHNKKDPLAHIPTHSDGMWDGGTQYQVKKDLNDPNTGNMLPAGNNHPTVKPVALMNYLVTLITPPGGKVLDPFMGSGSTGMAVVEFGGEFTGCELDPNYVAIAEQRISAWLDRHQPLSKYETDCTTKTDK